MAHVFSFTLTFFLFLGLHSNDRRRNFNHVALVRVRAELYDCVTREPP
jgi:hypothetical protein